MTIFTKMLINWIIVCMAYLTIKVVFRILKDVSRKERKY